MYGNGCTDRYVINIDGEEQVREKNVTDRS
jgi:hypothetical protein